MAARKKSSKPRATQRHLDPAIEGVQVDDAPAVGMIPIHATALAYPQLDVDAPRQTRNQRKTTEAPPPAAPHPKPRRRPPGQQRSLVDDPFVIQRETGTQPNADSPDDSAPAVPPVLVSGAATPAAEPVVSAALVPPAALIVSAAPAPPAAPVVSAAPLLPGSQTPAPDPRNLFDDPLTPPPTTGPGICPLTEPNVVPDEDDAQSPRATSSEESDSSSDEDEENHLPLPPGIDGFSDLGRNSKTLAVVKPGPIPAAAQEAAFLLHAQYQRTIEELAAKHGKSPEAFYALLGSGSHLTRGRDFNSWAAWQAWYSVNGPSKPDHVSVSDWTHHVSKEYVQHINEGLNGRPDTSANRREVLEPTVQWYRQRFANQVANYRAEGKMKQVLDKVINECLRV
ncbi:hypothetical protein H0H92_005885, partial [Tricholoma furcatifolium]